MGLLVTLLSYKGEAQMVRSISCVDHRILPNLKIAELNSTKVWYV
jgi:hypothetical protein